MPILDFTGGGTLQTAQHGRQFWVAGSVALYVVGIPCSVASEVLQVVSECLQGCRLKKIFTSNLIIMETVKLPKKKIFQIIFGYSIFPWCLS